ncbi:hypothetical protein Tdes44962_MAKER08032 [Teratosphaeria destructans]|uniref:Uncharacterized protein n=1 Tax=Teratosphaeria destructans TaxID=418781 RepID=A0A9W7SXI9_9PEZI|nr:hypothetical protein Tdes44962_MAKER08032 [Teratosphaeria destructans]
MADELVSIDRHKDAHEHDNYWRLPPQQAVGDATRAKLQQQLDETCGVNHLYSNRVYKSAIKEQISRIRRGQLCYHHVPEQTLVNFIQARKLDGGKQYSLPLDKQKARLILTLQAADDRLAFHPFLLLTPELRNAIYELYLAPLVEHPLHAPTWPPLARANRQLRDEVMSLFLHDATFDVKLRQWNSPGRGREFMIVRPPTSLYFAAMSEQWVSRMRRFRVCVEKPVIYVPASSDTLPPQAGPAPVLITIPPALSYPWPIMERLVPRLFAIDVRLDGDGRSVEVRYQGNGRIPEEYSRKAVRLLEEAVREQFLALTEGKDGGITRFGVMELSRLRTAVEGVLREEV